jgi:hypothetical protein
MDPTVCGRCISYKKTVEALERIQSDYASFDNSDFRSAETVVAKFNRNGGIPDSLPDHTRQLAENLIEERRLELLLVNRTRLCRIGRCALQT